jgi:hypothetical protein
MDRCIGALLLFAAKERLPTLATPLWLAAQTRPRMENNCRTAGKAAAE